MRRKKAVFSRQVQLWTEGRKLETRTLPQLIVPLWNLLQIAVYKAPLVSGASAVIAAIIHGIGPGVSEEIFCRGFVVSNLMRIRKDKSHRVLYCLLASGIAFGLLHMPNVLATKDIGATIIQVLYTAIIGIFSGAVYVRSRSLWGVMLMHTLTDITAFIAVFDSNATGMDIAFLAFGSVWFLALALYLIRPSKQEKICALWEDGWSFGAETEKNRAGAKTAGCQCLDRRAVGDRGRRDGLPGKDGFRPAACTVGRQGT